ncbi:MAG: DinB family protein [Ignavibacteria bacterium]
MKQLFLNLFEYDFWANSRTLNSLKQFDSPPAKAVELISHIINSQLIWLARIKQHPTEHEKPWKVYKLQECSDHLQKSNREWAGFINNLSEGSEDSEVFYKNTKGEEYRNKISDIILQVISHSHYHRGQIAFLVRQAGGIPALTDYIASKRL